MAVCCILRQIKKVRPKVNRISLLLCAVEAGACLIRLKSSNVHKKKERMYDPDYRKSKQHGKQFHLGCTGDGVHLRSRSVLKHPDRIFADPEISVGDPDNNRTDFPQTECFRWCADSVSGCLYGTGGNGRYRKYRRRCGRDRDRWTGRGVLDVDFCDPRHVYKVC